MNDRKRATCCCIILTLAASASADFVGLTAVVRDDPDTEFLCAEGNGSNVPGPLTVCNYYAMFDDPTDRLLSAETDLQVYNGENPDVFFQHPLNPSVISPTCFFIEFVAADLICDTFITIGYECGPDPGGTDHTFPGPTFDADEFANNGHVIGDWGHLTPSNGQGDAGTWPGQNVLFLQTSVAQGLRVDGMAVRIIWQDPATGDAIVETDIPVECNPCPADFDHDGTVGASDLALLLGSWGPCDDCDDCPADFSGDCRVRAVDLAQLLGAWGPCF